MNHNNLALYIASYDNADSAEDDFKALQDAWEADLKVVGAVVMHRDEDGEVKVQEHGAGDVGEGAAIGAMGGLVVGLFAPPLLLATAIGAGIGAGIGALLKRQDERGFEDDIKDYLPPGSSAIVAVVDDMYADQLEATFTKANRKVNKAIDSGDYAKVKREVDRAADSIAASIES